MAENGVLEELTKIENMLRDNDFYLPHIYSDLGNIAIQYPEQWLKISDIFYHALRSEKNDNTSLNNARESLARIIMEHPQSHLSFQAFTLFETSVLSEKNQRSITTSSGRRLRSRRGVTNVYHLLTQSLQAQPETAPNVFQEFKISSQF